MLEGLKPFYNSILRPVARFLCNTGIQPNHITLLGLALFGAADGSAAPESGLPPDTNDIGGTYGWLGWSSGARIKQKNHFRAILDSSCDRLTEMVLLMGILVYFLKSPQVNQLG